MDDWTKDDLWRVSGALDAVEAQAERVERAWSDMGSTCDKITMREQMATELPARIARCADRWVEMGGELPGVRT